MYILCSSLDTSLRELLELLHVAMVENGVRVHGGALDSSVLQAEIQPIVGGDDSISLEIHGVEHLLPSMLNVLL